MNQKNRLLREAFAILEALADGRLRPLRTKEEEQIVVELRNRIAKNLNITPAAKV